VARPTPPTLSVDVGRFESFFQFLVSTRREEERREKSSKREKEDVIAWPKKRHFKPLLAVILAKRGKSNIEEDI